MDCNVITDNFYVYAHCKPDGEPYYIGKGRGWRYCENVKRSKLWQRYATQNTRSEWQRLSGSSGPIRNTVKLC